MLKNLFAYRRYLLGSFWADLRYRYAGTALGFFWFVVNPLIEVFIYTVVFSQIISIRSGGARGVSYVVFLTSALFPWLAFSQMIHRGSDAIKSNALYMRRSLIPLEVFIFKISLVSMFSLLIYLVLLIPISMIAGNPLSWHALLMPLFGVLLILLGYGMSLALAPIRVLFADTGEVLSALLQLWRWTLPIMYTDDKFPLWLKQILRLNPPYYFIRTFRDTLIEHRLPTAEAWLFMGLWLLIFLALGAFISGRLRSEVKDLL